jgi:two-component system, NarL family, nitrate/nitrite response regulator NarL
LPRIAIIDDHAMFRDSLAALLAPSPEFTVCGSYAGLDEACEAIPAAQPDLVLLDLFLVHQRGSEFLRWAAARNVPFRILVVTASASQEEVRSLLVKGACGVIFKHSTGEQLIDAIRKTLCGVHVLDSAQDSASLFAPVEPDTFSLRERQVFQAMYSGKSNKEIATEMEISEAAVKATLQRIFDKTGVRSRGQLVRVALESYPDLLRPSG